VTRDESPQSHLVNRGADGRSLRPAAGGAVLLSEGIQKFLFAGELGFGRFTKIGIPMPEIMAPFVES
jgi:hypothetical protein